MRRVLQGIALCILAGIGSASATAPPSPIVRARAIIQGLPGSEIYGQVDLVQMEDGILEPVHVIAHIKGFQPFTVHGIAIHERGICDPPGFTSSGGHFDPGPASNSNPDANHPFHMGDLPNLVANGAGSATLDTRSNRISLTPGPLTLFDSDGSAVVIKANPDQGITGPPGSGTSGGPRIACGIIEMN